MQEAISQHFQGPLAFIGGGNMASAIIGGLCRQGLPADLIDVVEPSEDARARLARDFGVQAKPAPTSLLQRAHLVVWAVKPQMFRDTAQAVCPYTGAALHLSVAAGIRSDSIALWVGTQRVVRAMPNTPALVGLGMSGLFARAAVSAADRDLVERVLSATGELLWFDEESHLDAVTALSGSGPAYVFYFLEAMRDAGTAMGLPSKQALELAIGTFRGACALAANSHDSPQVLRERVTSKGGTTHAAILSMEAEDVRGRFMKALEAARQRAQELGDEFGR